MSRILIVVLIVMMVLGAGGCLSKASVEEQVGTVGKIGQIIITGSPTLGQVIAQLVVEYTECYGTWDKVNNSFPVEDINIVINGGGTGAGIGAVLEKTANFGLISRNVSETERSCFANYRQYQLGLDALAIAVNPENEIHELKEGLTSVEIQKIFSGEYRNWGDLYSSLPTSEIVLVTRDVSGGAHEVFQENIMGEKEVSPNALQTPSMGALAAKIIENKNSIGYASYGVVNQNKDKLIPLPVDGVLPTEESIISGSYKLSRPILIISDGILKPQERALLNFLTSQKAMKVIAECGFVPYELVK